MREQQELAVRRALSADLHKVARVWRESALSIDGVARNVPTVDALRRRMDAELRSGWDLRVAVLGRRVVGFLAIRPTDAFLDQIFVSPNDQGKGVGRALLKAAQSEMPGGFTLRMDAANELARCFYEKNGMTRVGEGIHPSTGIPVHFYGWNVSHGED